MRTFLLAFVGLSFLSLPAFSMADSKVLRLPVHDAHQPPLVILDENRRSGIYLDLYREILTRAGLKFEFFSVPKKRLRIMFEKGETFLTCCDNPAWRTRPLEQQVQLFSDPFYRTRDVFIFPPKQKFEVKNLSVLASKKVAVIRGYGYRGEEWFGERLDLGRESELLAFVALGRADLGIINEDLAKAWLLENTGKLSLGDYHDIATLHVRVHRERQDLLPRINSAIDSMVQDGTRKRILSSYFRE